MTSPRPGAAPYLPPVEDAPVAFPSVADVVIPHYEDDMVTLHHGDCLDVLRTLPDASVDAVVTDPPYGLEFMGREWDGADGFRRSLNPNDAGRDNAFGRTSRTSPEYRTGSRGAVVHDPATERGGFQDGNGGNAYSRSRIEYGRGGDSSPLFQAWCEAWVSECLRVLKPGGHLLAFGGSRTWHRLACAVEDAGFEVRDSIAWLYGSGFPKSMDVSKAVDRHLRAEREVTRPAARPLEPGDTISFDQRSSTERERRDNPATAAAAAAGWGTALKPAFEPVVVGRKPLPGTVAANWLTHGTGALNIDGCRVAHASEADLATSLSKNPGRGDTVTSEVYGAGRGQQSVNTAGRWPTNVLLGHSSECVQVGTRTETVGGGEKASGGFVEGYEPGDGFVGRPVSSPVYRCAAGCQVAELDRQSGVSVSRVGSPRGAASGDGWGMTATGAEYDDQGGASRFFPTFRYEAKAPTVERPRDGDVAHPTVKPLDLMRWLVRLVTPPGGTVLEPFAGSGTTAEACVVEGFRCIAIEREATYLPLIVARLSKPIQPDLFGGAA